METETVTDPFGAPGVIPSEFPSVASLRGRLVLIKPKSQQTVPNNLGAPGTTQERITADVTVVDGLGPVPAMKQNQPTGQMFAGPEFPGMWISAEIIVTQLADAYRTGGMVLGTVDTRTPGTVPMKGNPWGLIEPTEEQKQTARDFLAGRVVNAAQAPAPQQAPAATTPHPFTTQAPAAPQQYAAQAQAAPAFNPFAAPPQPAPPNPAAGNPFA